MLLFRREFASVANSIPPNSPKNDSIQDPLAPVDGIHFRAP